MRFPVVLFDLDGTVVDSGGIILASMRHATQTVLGREIPDAALMAAVGGPGLEAQMHEFGGDEHLDELVRVYRAHNEPLHSELRLCFGMDDVLLVLRAEGRRLGLVSAKRRATVEPPSRRPRSGICSMWSSAATRRRGTSRPPIRSCSRSSASRRARPTRYMSATRRTTWRQPRQEGSQRSA